MEESKKLKQPQMLPTIDLPTTLITIVDLFNKLETELTYWGARDRLEALLTFHEKQPMLLESLFGVYFVKNVPWKTLLMKVLIDNVQNLTSKFFQAVLLDLSQAETLAGQVNEVYVDVGFFLKNKLTYTENLTCSFSRYLDTFLLETLKKIKNHKSNLGSIIGVPSC